MPTDFTDGLRKLAALIDERELSTEYEYLTHMICCSDRDEMIGTIRKLGGKWDKGEIGGYHFAMTRELSDSVKVQVFVPRAEVCTAKVVGTKTVKRADPEAPLVDVEEDIIEWECDPVLARA